MWNLQLGIRKLGLCKRSIDQTYVKQIEEKLNSRPRKILKFLTPQEFYDRVR